MKLELYLPRYLQAISLPLLGPKIQSFFDFLCSASPYCTSILWHKIQSRSFSHAHTSNLPANRSRAINEVVKCFFMGKGKSGLQKTKLIDYVNLSAKGFTPTVDATIPSDAKFKDTKLFSIFLYSATPCCLSILWHKIQTSSS